MITKEAVLSIVSKMPDNIDLDDIQYQLYVLESVQNGLSEIDDGKSMTHEQAKKELGEWLE